ncbi:GDSL-type esterase/lipase family protein [Actinophytocola oryzae]|uniref:GDSL-type esterase/lipase family protein n=1 Tax=Actinophytocola oryzae TaxID=502181 RepID=UPI001414D5E5|nr:GDSL-type esterase/lipase family protein [Actinophytocola oryzae]
MTAVAVSVALAATATPALAEADSRADLPSAIVSMGDSFISGEAGRWRGNGLTHYPGSRWGTDLAAYDCNSGESWCYHDPARVYGASYDNGCHRSDVAEITHVPSVTVGGVSYPVAPENRVNLACSGATTEAIDTTPFKDPTTQADQLATLAETRRIRLITVSVGGNDIDFAGIIFGCVAAFTEGSSEHCMTTYGPELPARVLTMADNIRRAVGSIRTVMRDAGYADGDYRLVLQSYPAPIPASAENRYVATDWSRWNEGGCPFYDDDSDWAHDTVLPLIAEAIEGVTGADTGTEFLELRHAFDGHEVCAKGVTQATEDNTLKNPLPMAESEWIRWIGVPYLSQGQEQEYAHPNRYGQLALGRCLSALAAATATTHTCEGPA